MGKSGLAAVELLHDKHAARARPDSLADSEPAVCGRAAADVAAFRSRQISVVLSPGVSCRNLARCSADLEAKGIPVIGEVELAELLLQGPIIGITGSNGKTTTTAMIRPHPAGSRVCPHRWAATSGRLHGDGRYLRATTSGTCSSFRVSSSKPFDEFRANIAVATERHAGSPRPAPFTRSLRRRKGPAVRNAATRAASRSSTPMIRLRFRGSARTRRRRTGSAARGIRSPGCGSKTAS